MAQKLNKYHCVLFGYRRSVQQHIAYRTRVCPDPEQGGRYTALLNWKDVKEQAKCIAERCKFYCHEHYQGYSQGGVLSPLIWITIVSKLIGELRNTGIQVPSCDNIVLICRNKYEANRLSGYNPNLTKNFSYLMQVDGVTNQTSQGHRSPSAHINAGKESIFRMTGNIRKREKLPMSMEIDIHSRRYPR